MTKLEAVNSILRSVGLYNVSALDTNGSSEAAYIESIIDETSSELQVRGWHFNTFRKKDIALDGDNKLPVPAGTLAIYDNGDNDWQDLTQLGGFLYDIENDTDVFSAGSTVDAEVVLLKSWDYIPYAVQQYIVARSAVRYAENRMLKDRIYLLSRREDQAKTRAMRYNNGSKEYNILGSQHAYYTRGTRRFDGGIA